MPQFRFNRTEAAGNTLGKALGITTTSLKIAALLAFAAPLAACSGADRIVTSSIAQQDVRARHPIELAQGRVNLDVIPQIHQGAIDPRTKAQVKEFAEKYRKTGTGEISIALPQGGAGATEARSALPGLREALVAGGAKGYVLVSSYAAGNPSLASPIRLSFGSIVAQMRTHCGQWPTDLASGSSTEGWDNKPYWNFGCANQQMLAAQTADPRDLIGPAAETPVDSQMRGRGIQAVRLGKDPATAWTTQNSNIGGVGN
jgi:pilus assembly protein CpaD